MQKKLKVDFKEIIMLLGLGLIILIRIFWIDTYKVEGNSMESTFKNSDRVLVLKNNKDIFRNEVIIFKKDKKKYMKRIIATENQKIYFNDKNQKIYIDGEEILDCSKYIYSINSLFYKEVIVPKDSFFVIGDNKNDSIDSRSLGFIKKDEVKGTVLMKYWPLINEEI